ncbi:MAG TPA: hypothetical protein VF453_07660 [Burkholderiaceae bacterium]
MTRIVFEEIAVKGTFRWRDASGKRHQETRKFAQTYNPFNTSAEGLIKSRAQIYAEVKRERDLWLLRRENDQRDIDRERA